METTRTIPSEEDPDPREREEWFQRLPDAVKAEFREEWQRLRRCEQRQEECAVRMGKQAILGTAILFAFIQLLPTSGSQSLARFALGALVGAGLGWMWYRLDTERFQSMLSGTAVHVLFCAIWGDYRVFFSGSYDIGAAVAVMFPFLGILLVANMCAMSGVVRERPPGS